MHYRNGADLEKELVAQLGRERLSVEKAGEHHYRIVVKDADVGTFAIVSKYGIQMPEARVVFAPDDPNQVEGALHYGGVLRALSIRAFYDPPLSEVEKSVRGACTDTLLLENILRQIGEQKKPYIEGTPREFPKGKGNLRK